MRKKALTARRVDAALLLLLAGCSGQGDAPWPRVVGPARPARAKTSASSSASSSPAPRERIVEDASPPDPEGRRLFLDGIARPSVAASPGPPSHVVALALANTALGEAAEMKPRGAPLTAVLAAGQRLTAPAAIGPGECVTFIAQGGLGVIEVDLFLTQGEGEAATILAQDLASGPIAVIGGRRGCFKAPGGGAFAADLHAMVRRGQGPVLVRGFQR
jgi:hypothetical protein